MKYNSESYLVWRSHIKSHFRARYFPKQCVYIIFGVASHLDTLSSLPVPIHRSQQNKITDLGLIPTKKYFLEVIHLTPKWLFFSKHLFITTHNFLPLTRIFIILYKRFFFLSFQYSTICDNH